jgi:hypothetical protein
MVILKVGHHVYDDHNLFGTKQQQTLGPSRVEKYLRVGSTRWTVRRSMMGHRVVWWYSLWRCRLSASLDWMVRDPVAGADLLFALSGWSTL